MIVKNCLFDKNRDILPVSQTGFIDLQTAFVNNAVPSQTAMSEQDYNGIDDPASILGKPSDVFEAYEMESYVKEAGKTGNSEKDSANS